ncbi:Uncharacterised protein [Legionella sainthelensi]|uniref:Uncharacterized protein n=1 Tax=Legionella sainthelensi TaxID=28087 RepID=A0A0W0YB90_9GAMM|nr:hypothetical protein [Legionella sainthelensi]AUH72331.1 hypothetical protein CAB17_09825 [Legionella sainthelensi]KTD54119.1 hypothetical protein Lsai_2941 [Legionella sainthelensi]VEB34798.1 Uncharacterised protein [Legionella sainthelensi]
MKNLIVFLSLIFSCSVFAAIIPQDSIGAQKFDKLQCINNTAQDCINAQCMTSDQTDCQDNCQKMAQEKCQQQINE